MGTAVAPSIIDPNLERQREFILDKSQPKEGVEVFQAETDSLPGAHPLSHLHFPLEQKQLEK